MKLIRLTTWVVLLCTVSCQTTEPETLTCRIEKKDFVEVIRSSGTLVAVSQNTVMAPSVNVGTTTVAWLREEGSYVKEGDTLCVLESETLLGYCDQFSDEVEKVRAELVKQEAAGDAQLSLLEAQLSEIDIQTSLSDLDSLQMQFAPPLQKKILALEQQKRFIQREKLQKKQSAQKRINEQTIRALHSQIIQKELILNQFETQLQQLTILAPRNGILVYAESPYVMAIYASGLSTSFGGNLKLGSTVRRQQALFHLPDMDHMQLECMLPENDFKRISKAQKANVFPDAIDDLTCSGEVSGISLVGEKMDRNSALKYYKVTIQIDSTDVRLKPGLGAHCEIIITEIRDTLVVPAIAVFERDSQKLVYVRSDDYFIPTQVTTGTSNATETIITSGLSGHEVVALTDPPPRKIKKQNKKTHD